MDEKLNFKYIFPYPPKNLWNYNRPLVKQFFPNLNLVFRTYSTKKIFSKSFFSDPLRGSVVFSYPHPSKYFMTGP